MKYNLLGFLRESCLKLSNDKISYAIGVKYNNKLIFEKYSGFANYEYEIPICAKTVFPLSSLTKQFTGMIIMKMVDEGLIDYRDKVCHYLTDMPDYAKDLKIIDLLHHKSGLLDPYSYYESHNFETYNLDNKTIYQFLQTLDHLSYEIGEKFEYCNSNYVLLALLAEKRYNKPFRTILKEKIFQPLNMKDSDVYSERYVIKNRAYGYKNNNDLIQTVDIQWLAYGDGGIISTVNDLMLWDKALNNDSLLSQNQLEMAFTSGKTNDGVETQYGFGWVIKKINGIKILRHAGGDKGYGSFIMRIPEKSFSFIFLSNTDNSWKNVTPIVNDIEKMVVYKDCKI